MAFITWAKLSFFAGKIPSFPRRIWGVHIPGSRLGASGPIARRPLRLTPLWGAELPWELGVPQARWMVCLFRGKSHRSKRMMIWGYPHDYGNPQMRDFSIELRDFSHPNEEYSKQKSWFKRVNIRYLLS